MNYKKDEADNLLQKLGIVLKPEDKDKDGKALLKVIFLYWIIILIFLNILEVYMMIFTFFLTSLQNFFDR